MVEKERREEEESHKKRIVHADDVRAQIRQKEAERVMQRNAFFEEGVKLDEEARHRRQKMEEVKKKKLNELRFVFSFNSYLICFMKIFSTTKYCRTRLKIFRKWVDI